MLTILMFLFLNFIKKFSKSININKHNIKLADGKQLFYEFIYVFNLIKLEILKIYIEIHL